MPDRKNALWCVATFHATYAVLKAEKILKELDMAIKLIPVPRQISSNCGIALRFDCSSMDAFNAAVRSLQADLEGVFRHQSDGSFERISPAEIDPERR